MADVDRLIEEGEWLPAARALCAAGRHVEAADLYRRLSLPGPEAECARHAGDLLRAHRVHLEARDLEAAAEDRRRALAAVEIGSADALRRALGAQCADAGADADAAPLFEVGGDLPRALAAYERSGDMLAAARLSSFLGRHRHAAELLSGWLDGTRGAVPEAELTGARIALGRVLLRLGRPDEAAAPLQRAAAEAEDERRRRAALTLLLQAFAVTDRAAAVDEVWRSLLPLLDDPPADPRTFLAHLALDLDQTGDDPEEARWLAGRYRLKRLLGVGGAGQVYLAADAASGREVALKLVTHGPGGEDATGRFFREARIARSLSHPALVKVIEADPARGYLAMAYLGGGTLADRLRGGRRLPPAHVRRIGLAVAGALAAAHRRGVLHRDVKPENVLFDEAGEPHLSDFGAAHLLSFRQTATGYLLGTLAYMAPEQIAGEALGVGTDLFGLAVTLYRSLTGQLPFPGPDVAAEQRAGAAPPSSVVGGLSPEVDAFFARAFALAPADRFAGAEAFADALAALPLWGGETEAAAVPGPVEAAPAPVATGPGRYDVIGAMGERVALARDTLVPRHVVLERVPEAGAAAYLERVAALARAGNPHLQGVIDIDPDEGLAVYAFVDGWPLPRALDAPRGPSEALRLAADAARALVDHPGPLSPGRVLVSEGRAVVVVAGADALRGGSTPPADARPEVGRVLGWAATGRDPGPDSAPLEAIGPAPAGPPPAAAAALADWIEARLDTPHGA